MLLARKALPLALVALSTAVSALGTGCDQIAPLLPALAFCDAPAAPKDLAKLAEGPAIFVDAVRALAVEVSGQAKSISGGLSKGLSFDGKALEVLGPYAYQGAGAYTRKAADDRAFRLRFFYGDGVPGKTAGAPVEADMAQLSSFVGAKSFTDLLNPTTAKGPLFPLIEAAGFSSGKLALNDNFLRFDAGTQLASVIGGYDMKLNLGTPAGTASSLVKQLGEGKLALSLADTAMTRADLGFAISLKKFDMTLGLDGKTSLGGDYGFAVTNGPLHYFGAVKTVAGVPALSLRCGEDVKTEFATVGFVDGRADLKFKTDNFPITLPGLSKLYADVAASIK